MNDMEAKRAELRALLDETEAKLQRFRQSEDPAEMAQIHTLELGASALHVQLREAGGANRPAGS